MLPTELDLPEISWDDIPVAQMGDTTVTHDPQSSYYTYSQSIETIKQEIHYDLVYRLGEWNMAQDMIVSQLAIACACHSIITDRMTNDSMWESTMNISSNIYPSFFDLEGSSHDGHECDECGGSIKEGNVVSAVNSP
jgi:hypothetical protein